MLASETRARSARRPVSPERPMPRREGFALITGASQGLGQAMADECARRGMNLILVALPGSGLNWVAHNIAERFAVRVEFLEIDLTAPESPEGLSRWIADRGLPVSVLINNAGVGYNSRFEDSTLAENEACILLNNLALVKITHLLLPELASKERAYILNVASLAALFPMPYMPVYAPSKAFIVSFSLALKQEMAHTSLSVSALCPNGIRTNPDTCAKIDGHGLVASLTCLDPDQVARYAIETTLAGRAVIVPGFLNRCISAVSRLVPRALAAAVVSAFWGKTARRPTPVSDTAADLAASVAQSIGGAHEPVASGAGAL